MNILVVDDSRAVHAFYTSIFSKTKHTLVHAFNGQEGVNCSTNKDYLFSVILIDWEMPVLSGIEALAEMRSLGVKTPILMVTSKNEPASIALALTTGAADFIMKPFTQEILFGKLAEVCESEVA